ncbi:MAG: hypothetical protein V1676_00810 [Candidatus Diapherotrites archaeon]
MNPKLAVTAIFLAAIIALPPAYAATCGDGICNGEEDMCGCPGDCGICADRVPEKLCRNYRCVSGSCRLVTVANCCGNEVCEGSEGYANCPSDCDPTSLELTIMEPAAAATYFRGDSILIKVQATANGRKIPSAKLSATGPFERAEFYNDGAHEDAAFGDNISAARVDINLNAEPGGHDVKVNGEFKGVKSSAETAITITDVLEISASLNENYVLGGTVSVSGKVSKGGKPAEVPVDIRILSGSSPIFSESVTSSSDGSFQTQYRTSILDKARKVTVDINCSDSYGNHGRFGKEIGLIDPNRAAFLSVELLGALKAEYARGEEMLFSVVVKDAGGAAFDGATVSVALPNGGTVLLDGAGEGKYEGVYNVGVSMPAGTQEFTLNAVRDDNGSRRSGTKTFEAAIKETELSVEITDPAAIHFEIGESAAFSARVSYPWGELAENASCTLAVYDRNISMPMVETGRCRQEYVFREDDAGRVKITVIAEDAYGNMGIAERELDVSGVALSYLLMQNLPAILAGIAALLIVMQSAIYFFGRRRGIGRLEKEAAGIRARRREIEDRYFNKLNMGREEFEGTMQKCDARLGEINKELKRLGKGGGKGSKGGKADTAGGAGKGIERADSGGSAKGANKK